MTNTRRIAAISAAAVMAALLSACTAPGPDDDASSPRSATTAAPSPEPSSASETTAAPSDHVVGTVVNFTAGDTVVEVTITEDTATTRDFLSRLPMTQEFEDYGGQEKITYPEPTFDYTGTEGMAPQVGDLFSYKPWGNLGFFYNTDGLGHSDDLVRLGTTDDLDAVMELDGEHVTIAVAE